VDNEPAPQTFILDRTQFVNRAIEILTT
jgi:hypothetical protein